jgi:CRP/FNR family transcriptional regulator, cyclic AMP receptor protein
MPSMLDYCTGAAQLAFEPGTILLNEGRKTDRLYVLIEGKIEIVRDGVQVAEISEPGAILGEMSVLLDLPHTATARALSSGRAYELEQAKAFLRSRPDTAMFLAELLAGRLNQATAALVDLARDLPVHADRLNYVNSIMEGRSRWPEDG